MGACGHAPGVTSGYSCRVGSDGNGGQAKLAQAVLLLVVTVLVLLLARAFDVNPGTVLP